MRYVLIVAAMLAAGSAAADDKCGSASSEILALKEWSASPGDYGSVSVRLKIGNKTDKQIRMVKAAAIFIDPFGDDIARLAIDPDVTIPANGDIEEKGSWSAARLVKVRPQDVTTTVCVSAVLYEDGSKEEFR
ncbi:hypothetical protein ABK249_22925 [Neorhizobium sp. Rsf11]|uniref:Uncharacterized protein n=1 Tax=Neorhizobium phenanthreniclasticum TaxID=3157917 RepID=A0ABV0M7U8_9HYPH